MSQRSFESHLSKLRVAKQIGSPVPEEFPCLCTAAIPRC